MGILAGRVPLQFPHLPMLIQDARAHPSLFNLTIGKMEIILHRSLYSGVTEQTAHHV